MWCVWHFSTCVRGSGSQRPLLSWVAVIWLFPNKLRVYRPVPSKGPAQPCCNASPVSPVLILCTQLTAKPPWNQVTLGKQFVVAASRALCNYNLSFYFYFLQTFSLSCCYLLPVSCTTAGLGLKIQTADHKNGPAVRFGISLRLVWGSFKSRRKGGLWGAREVIDGLLPEPSPLDSSGSSCTLSFHSRGASHGVTVTAKGVLSSSTTKKYLGEG